jgi:hypothetical protein
MIDTREKMKNDKIEAFNLFFLLGVVSTKGRKKIHSHHHLGFFGQLVVVVINMRNLCREYYSKYLIRVRDIKYYAYPS